MQEKDLVSFDKVKIHYVYHKSKHPITLVFLHGIGGNWTVWKKELKFFMNKGYSVLAVDLRGHGMSEAPTNFKKYKLYNFSRDINLVLKKEKIKNFVLIGHSLGGGIAINYIMRYKKQPKSMVLIESCCSYPFNHQKLFNRNHYVTHLLRYISSNKFKNRRHFSYLHEIDFTKPKVSRELHLISHLLHLTPLRTIVKTLDNVEKYVFNNKDRINHDLRHYNNPLLIIAGEFDELVPVEYSREIKKLTRHSKMKIIKNAHHRVIVDKANRVNHEINNFLMEKII